jgi:hypothetical protein
MDINLKVETDRRRDDMKHFPVFLLIIPAGLLVVMLMIPLSLHLETIIRVTGFLLFGENSPVSILLFYVFSAAIPLLSGVLMCFVVMLVSRGEDKRYEREREEARRNGGGGRMEFMACFDSMNTSIEKLREISAQLRDQTKRLSSFGSETTGGEQERYGADAFSRDTFSVTLEDSEVSGLRIIHPADFREKDFSPPDTFRQESFPPPESHQKIWFFPNI